jgi:GMP synthase-like glutamine amidotransferase
MRSLILRFEDCEGPGLLEPLLREKGYSITYHDVFRNGLSLLPSTHLLFDFFLFLGGSDSVYDPTKKSFFSPYLHLIEDILRIQEKQILGICLGSQLLAHVLGGTVVRGDKGGEIGFGKLKIEEKENKIFYGIDGDEITGFHFHNDIFSLPSGSKKLLSSEKYENQMFSYSDSAIGILPHFELTSAMFSVWRKKFMEIKNSIPENQEMFTQLKVQKDSGEILLRNILSL